MSNPFAAAIRVLLHEQELRGDGQYTLGVPEWEADRQEIIQSCANARRVLEAAGKVDKEFAIKAYESACVFIKNRGYITPNEQCASIRILLKALPDPAQKEPK